jgi:hypothetical protein
MRGAELKFSETYKKYGEENWEALQRSSSRFSSAETAKGACWCTHTREAPFKPPLPTLAVWGE